MKKKNTGKEISYYELRLRELLNESYPNLATDEKLIKERADLAAQAYENAYKSGISGLEADEVANSVLFQGLNFSPFDVIFRVVCDEFSQEIPDDELRPFALKIFPECTDVFEKYELHKDFEDTPEYDELYSELTDHIQIWIEENGL